MAREAGNRAAYAQMSGAPNSWKQSTVAVNGHQLAIFTLTGKPNITEIFLRLPDGNPDGSGAKVHHHQSYLYDSYDSQLMCYTPPLRAKNHQCDAYAQWLSRQYRVQTGPGWDEPCLVPDLSTISELFGGEPPSVDEGRSRRPRWSSCRAPSASPRRTHSGSSPMRT